MVTGAPRQPAAPPPVQRLGNAVLLHAPAAAEVRRILSGTVARQRRDGIAPSPLLAMVLDELRNCAELRTHAVAELDAFREGAFPALSFSDPIAIKEAAEMLNCSAEYVRRLARQADLPARRTRNGWAVSRSAVESMRDAKAQS